MHLNTIDAEVVRLPTVSNENFITRALQVATTRNKSPLQVATTRNNDTLSSVPGINDDSAKNITIL